jgi:hypothetical protein
VGDVKSPSYRSSTRPSKRVGLPGATHRPEQGRTTALEHWHRLPRERATERSDRVREVLRDRCLVHEQPAMPQHARDFPQRSPCAGRSSADVIAGAEVDHEIEARGFERQVANIREVHVRRHAERTHVSRRRRDECGVDIHADERRRRQLFGEHRERDPSSAPDLQHPAATRQTEGTDQ